MRNALRSVCVVLAVVATSASGWAAQPDATEATKAKAGKLIDNGLKFLASQQQDSGGWMAQRGAPAITALALKGFAQDPRWRDNANVKKGFDFLLSFQLENGGIYRDTLSSYNTSTAISALAAAKNPDYQPAIDKAIAYLRTLQWQEGMDLPKGEKLAAGDPRIGGWGYGSKGRPDGSNTSFALNALVDAGISREDPMFKQAAEFMSRTQNLPANSQPWAGNDGGFIYSPANGGESFAGDYTDSSGTKRFHSYGSMTYAGLKSLLYANITRDDPRVVAAWGWISSNWSLTENPGMRNAGPTAAADGIFYYYHILARTLKEYGETAVPTNTGSVDWRVELVNKLESLQRPDGSWKGGKAYMEELEILVTAYSVLALQEVLADLERSPVK
jgi:squalene-hopene/tetraprenyl-beta-curcumene cyclase